MDPTPPDADGVARAAEFGKDAARLTTPTTPFAKPASRSFVAIVALVLAGMTGLAWRTGLYRVGMDSAVFLGPVVSGLLGERLAGFFVALVGAGALVVAGRLTFRPLPRRVA